jgi:type IV pilus assembly protein PilC
VAIAEQSEEGDFKTVVSEINELVKGGDNFSKALSRFPKIFDVMFISMVKASEASGRMAEMLSVLSEYINFESEIRKRIRGALTYPFIMAAMAVVATVTLMCFVLPRFIRIYEAKEAALPKLTQILVSFSKATADAEKMAVFVTFAVLASISLNYWLGTNTGRRFIDFLKIRTPVLGTLFVDTVITRSMRIMATMVNTGVSLLDTIKVVEGCCENYYFQQLWVDVDEKVRDGYQLSESIQLSPNHELIAPGILQMLRAGESSGRIGEVSDRISVFYEKKLKTSIKAVMTLIEPLMITILGGIIGTIAIALLLPVFRISTIVAH